MVSIARVGEEKERQKAQPGGERRWRERAGAMQGQGVTVRDPRCSRRQLRIAVRSVVRTLSLARQATAPSGGCPMRGPTSFNRQRRCLGCPSGIAMAGWAAFSFCALEPSPYPRECALREVHIAETSCASTARQTASVAQSIDLVVLLSRGRCLSWRCIVSPKYDEPGPSYGICQFNFYFGITGPTGVSGICAHSHSMNLCICLLDFIDNPTETHTYFTLHHASPLPLLSRCWPLGWLIVHMTCILLPRLRRLVQPAIVSALSSKRVLEDLPYA